MKRALLAPTLLACASAPRADRVSEPLPAGLVDLELPTATGAAVRLADLRGKVVLLDVCATWCGPCRDSLPTYADLQRELGPRGFAVLAVSVDEDADAVRRFLQETPLPYPLALDPGGRIPEMLGVDTMPECFLIDRDGLLRLRQRGFRDGDGRALRAEILRLLGGS